MADEYHIILVLVSLDLVRHAVYQSGKGFLTAPDLSDGDQMPFVIHVKNGLDIDHSPQNGCRLGDTAAPVQMEQIVHSKIMAQMQLVLLHPVCHLIKRLSSFLQKHRLVDQQALAQGRA